MDQPAVDFGFSTCPNDTFAFHALVHGLVAAPFAVRPVLLDIEELNRRAHVGELDGGQNLGSLVKPSASVASIKCA